MSEITQADRDAAVEYLEYFGEDWHAMEVLKGLGDNFKIVQLFARHRLAERAKIVAWLRELAEEKGFLSVEDIEQALQETGR